MCAPSVDIARISLTFLSLEQHPSKQRFKSNNFWVQCPHEKLDRHSLSICKLWTMHFLVDDKIASFSSATCLNFWRLLQKLDRCLMEICTNGMSALIEPSVSLLVLDFENNVGLYFAKLMPDRFCWPSSYHTVKTNATCAWDSFRNHLYSNLFSFSSGWDSPTAKYAHFQVTNSGWKSFILHSKKKWGLGETASTQPCLLSWKSKAFMHDCTQQ